MCFIFQDSKIIETSDRMIFQQDNQRLHLYHTEVEDEGTYQCRATSSIGFDSVEGKLRIRGICYVYFIKKKTG